MVNLVADVLLHHERAGDEQALSKLDFAVDNRRFKHVAKALKGVRVIKTHFHNKKVTIEGFTQCPATEVGLTAADS